MIKKIFLPLFVILLLLPSVVQSTIYAQTTTPSPSESISPIPTQDQSQAINDVQNRIKQLEGKINDLQGQEKTLNSQIDVFDNQISLTELRISSTKSQISDTENDIAIATDKIGNLETSLDKTTKALLQRMVIRYEAGSTDMLPLFTSSDGLADYMDKTNYLRIVSQHDRQLLFDMQQAKNDYSNQKQLFVERQQKLESLKSQLEAYNTQLDQQKSEKQRLLSETQGDEATYEKLLSQARAQLAGFSKFVASQGGASLLSNQTVCDDWGCYYNQRDTQWGAVALNNTQYSIASDGCLMTSMAMVYTHYGHKSVTPLTINSDPNNFASYEPAWLLKTITADGATATRISSSIDSELSAGKPVIVGVSYDGGPYADHFVVLISGSNGNYQMNDPYTPNGHNIPFTSHYSLGSIVEIEKVSI